MDAVMNFTVNRPDPVLTFDVNTKGAFHVMKAAADLGITKVVHTGPFMIRGHYEHNFDMTEVPVAPGAEYSTLTKYLGMEIVRTSARTHRIHTVCFLFVGLGAKPTERVKGQDFHSFFIVWEDLQHACRLALDIEEVPGYYQDFNLHSHRRHERISMEKAKRILGYEPLEYVEDWYRREP